MQRVTGLLAVVTALGFASRLSASDATGIYALIEEVKHSGEGTPDETVRLRGVFSLAKSRRDYATPRYGYMYFRITTGSEASCRREWADLKRVAGTGQLVAFAMRPRPDLGIKIRLGRVRKLSEKPAKADEFPGYSRDFGVQKVRRSLDYLPHRRLAYFPKPSSPADGAAVEGGRIKLTCHNVVAKDERVKYFFEIKDAEGKTESSDVVEPGEKQTSWKPEMKIASGKTYTWRVWTVTERKNRIGKTETWKSPVATTQFQGKN